MINCWGFTPTDYKIGVLVMGQVKKGGLRHGSGSEKGGILGMGQVKKGGLRHGSGSKKGGILGTGQVKKGGLYCGTYLYWTYI